MDRTRELLRDLRATAARRVLPPPLVDSPKCPRCSLVGICLPDETHLLQLRDELGAGGVSEDETAREGGWGKAEEGIEDERMGSLLLPSAA